MYGTTYYRSHSYTPQRVGTRGVPQCPCGTLSPLDRAFLYPSLLHCPTIIEYQRYGTLKMIEVEAVKTAEQRQQVEAHLADHGELYADIWKVLRISDLLSLTMEDVRALDTEQPALHLKEQKTGKHRKIVVNQTALTVMQRRLAENPQHVWLFQSEAVNLNKRQSPKPINRRSVSRVFEQVGQRVAPKVALGTHSMRKTRGYAMHKAGRSIENIAKVLNHSSPAVTMRYIGLVQQDIDESYTELEL